MVPIHFSVHGIQVEEYVLKLDGFDNVYLPKPMGSTMCIFLMTSDLVQLSTRPNYTPIYDIYLYVELMGEGLPMAPCPFWGTGCPVQDAGFNSFMYLFQMLEMLLHCGYIILMCLQ